MHIVIVYGHLQHLEVDLLECVFEVKEKSQLLGHPVCKQILSFNGEELTDCIGLNLLDVTKNARLNLTINSTQKPFKMKVKILGGEIFLEVEELDTVVSLKDLKDKILDKIGDPHEEQLALLYRGNEMRNDQHLCEYRVGMNSEIIATCGENWPFIEFDEFETFEMAQGHTVGDLKERLVDKNYHPQGDYFFFHGERIMEYSESLLSHGVKDGDSIIVLTRRARRQH